MTARSKPQEIPHEPSDESKMPALKIPSSGWLLHPHNEDSKPGIGLPEAFGLTLADSVIEDMIRCVKSGKQINLALGKYPILTYESKHQHLQVVTEEDPYITTEIYQTKIDAHSEDEIMAPPSHFITRVNKSRLVPTNRRVATKALNAAAQEVDAATAALEAGMKEEMAKKASSAILKENPPSTGKRRGAKPATNRFLAQNKKSLGSDTTRSMPTSPALSGVGSPSLGPTSVPLSQQKAEKDREIRSWIIHYLAVEKAKEEDIWEFFSRHTHHTRDDFKTALDKNADYDSSSKTWNLRDKAFKELDPWAFEYPSQEQRQKAIERAIKAYDKARLSTSEPQWQKLLPESERGQGKVLSKLAEKIAQKSSAPKNGTPGHDNNTETEDDKLVGENLSVKKVGGESMSRSASSGPATKNKKVSEKEAQAKRLLGKGGKAKVTGKASPATKTSPAKKPVAKKEDTSRIKSSQFVNESDEEDDDPLPESIKKEATSNATPNPKPVAPSVPKPAAKRPRAVDSTEVRAAQPPIKKARKDEGASTPLLNGQPSYRTSDSSQNSQNSNSSRSTVASSIKTKTSSPQKSSPLASSPPTNASDIDEEDPYHTSSSASPYTASMNPLKRKAADNNTRATKKPANGVNGVRQSQKPASASSASPASSNGRVVPDEVLDLADKFKKYYGNYLRLHRELENTPNPSEEDISDLTAMHMKLQDWKEKIFESVNQ